MDGCPLVKGLIASGEHVTILSRGKKNVGETAHKNIDHLLGDVSFDQLRLADRDYRRLCLSVKKISSGPPPPTSKE